MSDKSNEAGGSDKLTRKSSGKASGDAGGQPSAKSSGKASGKGNMTGEPRREYPDLPIVGVGGIVIQEDRVLLIRRGNAPALGEWSIPGGIVEVGETLVDGVEREMLEETGVTVHVLELVEALERIFYDPPTETRRPRFHYVILDYLCEALAGDPRPGGDVTDVAWVHESDLPAYDLHPLTAAVLQKAFAMSRR